MDQLLKWIPIPIVIDKTLSSIWLFLLHAGCSRQRTYIMINQIYYIALYFIRSPANLRISIRKKKVYI